MKQADFERQTGRKVPPEATYIDLDEQNQPKPRERETAGWTDTQIRNRSMQSIDADIASGEAGIDALQAQLDGERQRVMGLRQIKKRKKQLGD